MRKIFISLAMALSIVSCSTEELSNGGGNDSQKGVVQLVLSTDGFDVMGSRAVNESAIHDVNILEYINGVLTQVVYLTESDVNSFNKTVAVSGLDELPATLMEDATDADGNKVQVMKENGIENFIFVVANYGKKIEDRTQVLSLKDLQENLTMSFSGKKTMTNLPMTGFYYGGINDNSVTQMNVSLQRAVAKVNFTLDTSNFAVKDGSAPSQILVNSIKLCNVPNEITLYPCQDRPSLPKNDKTGNWKGTPFPTVSEMASSVTYGDEQNQSSTANTYEAYIPENARGSFSTITGNKDKHPSKCDNSITDEKADKTYTYIFVDLDYVMSDGTGKNATYRIYLGGNNTGDMNLLRNTQYNITTFLYGADPNSTDTRISTENIVFVDDMKDKPANCYMIDMSDVQSGSKKFVIPLSQVNNGWAKIAEYDKTSESAALKTQVADMIKSGNWEIQTEWRTWEKGSNITGTKVADFSASNPRAVLIIPADIKNGENAVVKLVSKADGKTYWSWHLWFTDYKPSASGNTAVKGQVHQYISDAFDASKGGIYAGKYMMDRNLGATITGVSSAISQPTSTGNAIKYYGLCYQWGRKDPFVGSGNGSTYFASIYDADGNLLNNEKSPATPPFKTVSTTTSISIATSVYNPGTFYYGTNDSKYDWLPSLQDDLWDNSGTSKSVFDPCPPGWRVPLGGGTATNSPWAGLSNGDASSTSSGNTCSYFGRKAALSGQAGTEGRLYSYSGTQAWYPASGRLLGDDGTLIGVGDYGYIWSASPYNQYGYNLFFGSGGVHPSSNNGRSYGFPVRCIQE